MRAIVGAFFFAAGMVIGACGASSAPASGAGLERAGSAATLFSDVRYYRSHGHLCYTKCYREFVIGRRVCRKFC